MTTTIQETYSKTNPSQIIRIDAKKTFLEVMDTSFNINKVRINFIEYDKDGTNKQLAKISIYLSIEDMLRVINDVKTGRIPSLFIANQKSNSLKTLGEKGEYEFLGGTTNEILATRKDKDGKSLAREDGNPECRILKLQGGKMLMLRAELGAGKIGELGGISPQFTNNKPEVAITVAMSILDLKRLALLTEARIIAYMSANETVKLLKKDFNINAINDINNK